MGLSLLQQLGDANEASSVMPVVLAQYQAPDAESDEGRLSDGSSDAAGSGDSGFGSLEASLMAIVADDLADEGKSAAVG